MAKIILFILLICCGTTHSAASDAVKDSTAYKEYEKAERLYDDQKIKEAMTVAQTALQKAVERNEHDLQIEIHSLLTAIYSRLGMFEEGLKSAQICYEESERTDDKEGMSSDLNNMAALFISLKQYDKAKLHIDKAITIERSLKDRDNVLAIRLGIASETYMLLGKLTEAEAFAREAYKLDSEADREGKVAIRLSQLAAVLIKKGQLAEAKEALRKAIPALKESGNTYSYIICENQLGDVSLQVHKYAEAEMHYLTALNLAQGSEFRYMKQRALQGLWKSLKNTDIIRAAKYIEQYTLLSDTLHTEAIEKQLANMQAQYEYNELQAANEQLVYQNHINTLRWAAGIIACLLIITILCYTIHVKSKSNIIARQTDLTIKLIEEQKAKDKEMEKIKAMVKGKEKEQKKMKEKEKRDAEFINTLVNYVNKQLSEGKSIDTSHCASHLCISPRHLTRKITAITGYTPSTYINRIKIKFAKRLLTTESAMSIKEIATESGFEDLAYFGKIFRQIEGMSPTQYRNNPSATAESRNNND